MPDTKTIPGQPTSANEIIYSLYYRERRNPHPLTKQFYFKEDIRAAIARAKQHCESTNLVFIHVRPFLSNLEEDEKRHIGIVD